MKSRSRKRRCARAAVQPAMSASSVTGRLHFESPRPSRQCHLIDDTLPGRAQHGDMSSNLHPRLRQLEPLTDALTVAAQATAKAVRRKYRETTRKKGYTALRPGSETPLWNELARACEAQLTRYGEKARLARILGVTRQRVHLLLVSKTACADAERTLQLLAWLADRHKGVDPA